jgi:hypothetical protein
MSFAMSFETLKIAAVFTLNLGGVKAKSHGISAA